MPVAARRSRGLRRPPRMCRAPWSLAPPRSRLPTLPSSGIQKGRGGHRTGDRGQDGIPLLGITGDHRFDRRAGNAIIEIGRRGPCDGLAIHLICHLLGVDKRATRRSSRLLRKAEPQAQDRPADLGVDAVGPSPRRSPQRVDENNLEAPVMKTLVNLAVIAACRPPPGSPRGREATCPPARGVVRKTMRQMSRLALLTPATILTIVPCSSPYDDTGSNPSIQRGTSREVGRSHSVAALSRPRSKRQPPRRSFDPRSPVRVRSGERNLSATIALPQIHIFPPPNAVDDFIIKGTKPSSLTLLD